MRAGSAAGMPGPRSTTRTSTRGPDRPRAHDTGWSPEKRAEFSSRLANARSSCAASAWSSGRSASSATRTPPGGRRRRRGAHELLDRAPVGTRLGRARLEPRQVEQVVDQARQPVGLAADVGHRARRARASVIEASRARRPRSIAVSGERRSCETARSTAVLTTFERRSALVSTTCEQLLALEGGAQERLQGGHTRSWRRQRRRRHVGGHSSAADGAAGARGAARRPRRLELDRRGTGARTRRRSLGRPAAPRRVVPRSSSRAISAARSASRRRFSASRPARGRAPRARWRRRRHEEDAQRDPVLALGDREAPGGGCGRS